MIIKKSFGSGEAALNSGVVLNSSGLNSRILTLSC